MTYFFRENPIVSARDFIAKGNFLGTAECFALKQRLLKNCFHPEVYKIKISLGK
jgi:hypothetical protein